MDVFKISEIIALQWNSKYGKSKKTILTTTEIIVSTMTILKLNEILKKIVGLKKEFNEDKDGDCTLCLQ